MKRTNNDKYEALREALERAKVCAANARQDDDGGTSNFDSPVIDYRAMGMSKKKAVETVRESGLSCFDWYCYGRVLGLVLCGMTSGQGNCRTKMAEAFQTSLVSDGIAAGMYYQCD